jgi:8-amino-7-oxononanoate synthase
MTDPLAWTAEKLADLAAGSLLRTQRTVAPLPDGWCRVEGRELRNFATNDYLNLAGDPRLSQAAQAALDECGVGARASALVCGHSEWHETLEERLARFEGTEAAILFPSGFAANLGTVAALAGVGDAVFCDRLNHASLVDGCKLSGARLRVYRHAALRRLDEQLAKAASARRRVIVTDAVFSMDGDLAPIAELCALADKHAAALIVDEAHGTGVYGPGGRGVCEHFGFETQVDVRVGTLSKAIGVLGGFVAGSRTLVDYLLNTARTQIYSTALPPALCAAACAALEIIENEPERRTQLHERATHLRERLRETGFEPRGEESSPIVPVVLAEPDRAVATSRELETKGFLVPAIRPPTVPRGTSRLRISLTCAHSADDVHALVDALVACR